MPQDMIRRQADLAVQRRASEVGTYNADTRTVELTAATGVRVRRYDWDIGYYWEELAMTPDAVDLSRVEAGQCPLLDSHSRWSIEDQLGIVESARLESSQLITPVRFSEGEKAKTAEANVANRTLTGVSIGYRILELSLIEKDAQGVPVYRATKWALMEVSLTPVPADPAAGVRSETGLHPCVIVETRKMPPENEPAVQPAADQNRVAPAPAPAPAPVPAARGEDTQTAPDASAARMSGVQAIDFVEDARALGVDVAQARGWAEKLTPDAARGELLRAAADKQRDEAPRIAAGDGARITHDARDKARDACSLALLNRFEPGRYKLDGAVGEGAREWRGMSLLEMARSNLEANGEKVRGLSRRELADMALRTHSTSDFPYILANVANKTLRQGYESSPQTFKAWQRRATAADFKQIQRTQLGGAPGFLLVPEGGEFKMGTIGEGKEVYALATYGRKFSITRQTLINDDLDAFSRIPVMMGRAAADLESDTAYAPLIANPNMGDSVALFHASHGNLAGSGAAISETTISAREAAMGIQTGLEGRYINVTPKFLIVAPKDKVAAQKMLTAVMPTATSGVNVYANSMDLVVEARLSRSSGAVPWFMAADPAQVDTIEYAYLEGEEGVYLEERAGFDIDGMEFKARLDIASKAIDWRGLQMDPGTA